MSTGTTPSPASDGDPNNTRANFRSDTRPGSLPVPPPNLVTATKMGKDIRLLLQMSVRLGACLLIGGPVGIGKTTAVAEAARGLDCAPVYINMFGTTSTRDQMQTIWEAMTGTRASGNAALIRDQILDSLKGDPVTLLIDDAHHVGFSALASILSIWDRVHTTRGRGTPIVLCGNNLERHLKERLPELLSRSALAREFKPVAGKALADLVLAMEPRIAGTPASTIRDLDNRHFRGDLRRWRQFFDMLDLARTDTEPRPLTLDETQSILAFVPRSTR